MNDFNYIKYSTEDEVDSLSQPVRSFCRPLAFLRSGPAIKTTSISSKSLTPQKMYLVAVSKFLCAPYLSVRPRGDQRPPKYLPTPSTQKEPCLDFDLSSRLPYGFKLSTSPLTRFTLRHE